MNTLREGELNKAETLANAQPFDLHLFSLHAEVEDLVQHIYDKYVVEPNRARYYKIADVIRCFVLNLIAARANDESRYVRFSLRRGRYTANRYNPQKIGYRNFERVLSRLLDEDFIDLELGIPAIEGFNGGKQSRMRATRKLVDLVAEFRVTPEMISRVDDEVIILRGVKDEDGVAKQINYKDTRATKQMRERLLLINERIAAAAGGIDIQLSSEEMEDLRRQLILDSERDPIDMSRIRLRRIFNNKSFERGGRFYHGWWQQVPRKYRSYIQINGRVTSELDYSGMHIAIFYAKSNATPEGDPYMLPDAAQEDRSIIKIALNAAINAATRKEAELAIRDEARVHALPSSYDSAGKLLEAIVNRHEPIKDYIGSGAGLWGQFIDSQIAERVMLELGDDGVVVLPVHDSFLVEQDRVEQLHEVMAESFRTIVGADCLVDMKEPNWITDGGPPPLDFRHQFPEMDTRNSDD